MIRICCSILLMTLMCVPTASAHKLLLTAWVEDGAIVVETAFSNGGAADGAKVQIFAANGTEIFSGEAGADGIFESPIPAAILQSAPDLRVVSNAGAGHMIETIVPGEDYAALLPDEDTAVSSTEAASAPAEAVPADALQADALAALQESIRTEVREGIREEVQAAVRKEVQPLKRELLAMRDAGPGMTEVVGGIGYIFGLAGLILLLKAPGRSKTPKL